MKKTQQHTNAAFNIRPALSEATDVVNAANEDIQNLPADEPLNAVAENSFEAKERSHGRRHKRVHHKISVTLNGESEFFVGRTENISAGGIFVFTHCPWKLGTQVDLSITLQGMPFFVSTVVRWTRPKSRKQTTPGLGLEFIRLCEHDLRTMHSFVQEVEDSQQDTTH